MPHWFQCHRKSLFSLIGCLWLALTIGGLAAVGAMPLTVNKICRSGPRSYRATGTAAVRASQRVDVIEPRERDAQVGTEVGAASQPVVRDASRLVRPVPVRRAAHRQSHQIVPAAAHAPPGASFGPDLASVLVIPDFLPSAQPAWAYSPLSIRPPPSSFC